MDIQVLQAACAHPRRAGDDLVQGRGERGAGSVSVGRELRAQPGLESLRQVFQEQDYARLRLPQGIHPALHTGPARAPLALRNRALELRGIGAASLLQDA